MGTYDAVGYALVRDALTHAGPAKPSRVSRSVCSTPLMPGVKTATFATDYAAFVAYIGHSVATAKLVKAEPPLACYVLASGCGAKLTRARQRAG